MASYGVFIGLNEFVHFPGESLRFCENDASEISKQLLGLAALEHPFSTANMALVSSASPDGTVTGVYHQMERMMARCGPSDQFWLFIASHGFTHDGENYIMATDTRRGSEALIGSTCISLSSIKRLLANCRASQKMVFLDVCHAASASFYRALNEARDITDAGPFSIQRSAESLQGSGAVIFYSCAPLEKSYEDRDSEHGLWTSWLLRAFREGSEAFLRSGDMTPSSLQTFLHDQVHRDARNRLKVEQTPHWENFATKDFTIGRLNRPLAGVRHDDLSPRQLARRFQHVCAQFERQIGPFLQDLGHQRAREELSKACSNARDAFAPTTRTPAVVLGGTGVGKTSLLNAVAGCLVGESGAGNIQSAAPLIIEASENKEFVAEADFLPLETLIETAQAAIEKSHGGVDYSRLPHEQGLDDHDKTILRILFPEYDGASPAPIKPARSANEAELRSRWSEILERQVAKVVGRDMADLHDFIENYTNCEGRAWPIAQQVTVTGPFPGLDAGISIVDLPGTRDPNPVRSKLTRDYLKRADQVIVVTTDRGLEGDIFEELAEAGFVGDLVANPDRAQIMVVGTKMDVPAGRSDVRRLGLGDQASAHEILARRMEVWPDSARARWEQLIGPYVSDVNQRTSFLASLRTKTRFIPTVPPAFLDIAGIAPARMVDYGHLLKGKKTERIEKTGIPRVIACIRELHADAEATRHAKMARMVAGLESKILAAAMAAVQSAHASVTASREDAQLVNARVSVARKWTGEMVSSISFGTLQGPGAEVQEAIEVGLLKAWENLSARHIRSILDKRYGRAWFATLAAAFRRGGIFKSSGKAGLIVNVPHQLAIHATDEIVGIVEGQLLEVVEQSGSKSLATLAEAFGAYIENCTKTDDRSLGTESPIEAAIDAEITAAFRRVAGDLDEAAEAFITDMNKLRNALSEHLQLAISEGFKPVFEQAEAIAKGKGARAQMLDEFAEIAARMLQSTASRSARVLYETLEEHIRETTRCAEEVVQASVRGSLLNLEESRQTLVDSKHAESRLKIARKLERAIVRLQAKSPQAPNERPEPRESEGREDASVAITIETQN